MFIVGLTGGIGSGKSTVCDLFKELGIIVIDADEVGRALVNPGSPLLAEIVSRFGSSILDDKGSLNRHRLRDIVFADPDKRKQLEAIMHPAILNEMLRQAALANSAYCIFAIPLLFETGQHTLVNRVLVVDTNESLQKQRVAQRDGLNEAQIGAIIAAQLPRSDRVRRADDIIDNNSTVDALRIRVLALHQKYLTLASPA